MVVGHKKNLDYLARIFNEGNFSHAYIFHGPSKVGKRTLALELMRGVHCEEEGHEECACRNCRDAARGTFPDTILLAREAESREIGIDEVRDLRKKLSLSSYSGAATTVLIDGAEYLTREAVSALLKVLEEPRRDAMFILITADASALPETIISRAELISFLPVPTKEIESYLASVLGIDARSSSRFAKYSLGRPGVAIEMARDGENHPFLSYPKQFEGLLRGNCRERFSFAEALSKKNKEIDSVLESLTIWLRDLLLAGVERGSPLPPEIHALRRILKSVRRTSHLFQHTNVNQKLALEALLLEL